MTKYATRLSEISAFKAMKVFARASELQKAGKDVIHLEVGEPDFDTPEPIVEAANKALARGMTKYTPAQGIEPLRQAISGHYKQTYDIDVPFQRIFVTAGGSGALLLATALTLNQAEMLMMTDPCYPCNRHFLKSFSGQAQLIPVGPEHNYQLTAELIDANWQPNTKGVLLASPANPTGSIIDRNELERIANSVAARSGFLVADEIYHGLHYGNQNVTTALEFDSIVINSFSKYFGMTGWRLGWLVVPEDAIDLVEKLAQNLFICASSIAQYAALAAFTDESRVIMERQRGEFQTRRDIMVSGLRELGFGVPEVPGGAFYVYARLPEQVKEHSEAFCMRLLEEYGVAVTPGTDFGFYDADRHVRFSYANNVESLQTALARVGQLLR